MGRGILQPGRCLRLAACLAAAAMLAGMSLRLDAQTSVRLEYYGDPLPEKDMEKIRACNSLSREVCREKLSPEDFNRKLQDIEELRGYRPVAMCLIYMLTSAAMTLFFGGDGADAAASAIAGIVLYLAGRFMGFVRIRNFVTGYIEAFLVGTVICLLIALGLGDNYDLISMGNIMLMISGSGLMTSIRDMINNDLISGMMGFMAAVIGAAAIALGFVSAALLFM